MILVRTILKTTVTGTSKRVFKYNLTRNCRRTLCYGAQVFPKKSLVISNIASSSNRVLLPGPNAFYSSVRSLSSAGDIVPFNLSDIGEGIREVEIKEWFVSVGQKVAQFDSICEVQSDKAAVTITSRYDGVIKKIYHEAGDKAYVGKPLVDIEVSGASSSHSEIEKAPVEQISPPQEEVVETKVKSTDIVPFNLSDIGEGIREVEVKEWFVSVGQKVAQFDSICEVQSDKAAVTITSRYDGVIKKIYHEAGDKAYVGKPLVDIEVSGASSSHSEISVKPPLKDSTKTESVAKTSTEGKKPSDRAVLATPAVRRMAREKEIDLTQVRGTGKDGRILKEDIIAFIDGSMVSSVPDKKLYSAQPAKPSEYIHTKPVPAMETDRVVPLTNIQKAMFRVMTGALAIPHFGYNDEFEVTELMSLRKKIGSFLKSDPSERPRAKVTFLPFFLKAASLALHKYPILNAALDTSGNEPKMIVRVSHNIGVAMDTADGLLVPVVKNVQNLSVFDIAEELSRLSKLGSEGKLSPADLTGATLTLSNIGSIGGTYAGPVITPPQVCIGAIGKIARVPRFVTERDPENPNREVERVKPVNIVYLSWSADHRVIDGATVARFSNKIKSYIESPAFMSLDLK